jgi:organic radical activating enzyme
MNHKTLPIAEVFYSIQGEGITTGYPSVFVRLSGCNLMCGGNGTQFDGELHDGATWRCDTIEVWMKGKMKPFDEVLDDECTQAITNGANLILTGGEPLMNQSKLVEFIQYVRGVLNKDCFVEVETNGTIEPIEEMKQLVDQWNCSPKLQNSGNDKPIRYKADVLEVFNQLPTQFKFVLSSWEDYDEIEADYSFIDPKKIWLMPSGEHQELLNITKPIVAEIAKKHYHKFTNRLHIEIWNKKTGV